MPDPQAPVVPSTTDLAALDPTVAIVLLVVVGVSIVAFYVGPIIRARFTRPPDPPPASSSTGAHALREPAAAIEKAADTTQQFIDHLLRQIEQTAARCDELEHRLAAKDREVDELQQQVNRLNGMLWQQQRGLLG